MSGAQQDVSLDPILAYGATSEVRVPYTPRGGGVWGRADRPGPDSRLGVGYRPLGTRPGPVLPMQGKRGTGASDDGHWAEPLWFSWSFCDQRRLGICSEAITAEAKHYWCLCLLLPCPTGEPAAVELSAARLGCHLLWQQDADPARLSGRRKGLVYTAQHGHEVPAVRGTRHRMHVRCSSRARTREAAGAYNNCGTRDWDEGVRAGPWRHGSR